MFLRLSRTAVEVEQNSGTQSNLTTCPPSPKTSKILLKYALKAREKLLTSN